jgi:NAD(P)-dependent dehydrogenase (short-subunit alcohol dehydrogenase family)
MEKTDGFASYPSLRDRVIIVTGGATGIGEAIVEAFAMQNAQVAFLDIQDEAAEQLTKRLTLDGATVVPHLNVPRRMINARFVSPRFSGVG